MLRTGCLCLTWLVLGGLLAPGAARAQVPNAVPPPPEPGAPAPRGGVNSSAEQTNYSEPVEGDTITTLARNAFCTMSSKPSCNSA